MVQWIFKIYRKESLPFKIICIIFEKHEDKWTKKFLFHYFYCSAELASNKWENCTLMLDIYIKGWMLENNFDGCFSCHCRDIHLVKL